MPNDGLSDGSEREQLALALERNVAIVLVALVETAGSRESPMGALAAACTVADTTDEVIQTCVRDARAAGHTWQEIGGLLAISRQAAQQRFGSQVALG